MTQQRGIEQLLDHWFSDGPDQAPDRVVDIVADRIERQSQRPAWRLQWRPFPVNAYSKIAVAAAAVLIVAVVGYNLLPGRSTGVGGPAPSPSPTVVPAGSPSASPAARILPEGRLSAGIYSMQPFIADAAGVTITMTVPDGWAGVPSGALIGPTGTDEPDGMAIGVVQANGAFDDPCRWDQAGTGSLMQPGETIVGPTVDDLVADLRANRSYVSTAPVDVVIDGYAGKQLDLQLPSDIDFGLCDKFPGDTNGTYHVLTPPLGSDASMYAQGRGNRWHLKIIDVDGARIIVKILDYAGTSAQDQAAAQAIVDSIQITP